MVCAAAIAIAGLASATPVPFEDDFEAVAVGDYPDENGWVNLFYGKGSWVSNEVPDNGSNNSFRLDCWPWSAAADYLLLDEVPDQFSYEASVYVHPVDGLGGYVGFIESDGVEGLVWNCFHIDGADGLVEFFGNDPDPVVLGAYTSSTWCTVRADLDYGDETADLWLDGACVAVDVPITPKQFDDPVLGSVVLNKLALVSSNGENGGGFIFSNLLFFDDVKLQVPEEVVAVEIDVKPGENPNPVNCSSRGLLPVAVLSSDSFDATEIDAETVCLAGASAAVRGRGSRYMAHEEDVNADGVLDMVFQFQTQDLCVEQLDTGVVVLTGSTGDGGSFQGTDEVVLVGKGARCRARQ
jgi:hypothetical protein